MAADHSTFCRWSRSNGGAAVSRLVVDWVACDGHGLCALAAPELIDLDDWGYPILLRVPDDKRSQALARSAVEACPVMALRLEKDPQPARR